MNSTYNVSQATLRIIKEQIEVGHAACEEVAAGRAGWGALFQPFRFFSAHKRYLQVNATVAGGGEGGLREFEGVGGVAAQAAGGQGRAGHGRRAALPPAPACLRGRAL
jgi:hypothetical protein